MVIFENLEKEDIHKIIDIELSHLYKRINALGYTLKISAKAKDYIVDKGWDPQCGARPLKRAIQKYVEDVLAEEMILHSLSENDTINLDYDDKKDEMKVKIKKAVATVKKK